MPTVMGAVSITLAYMIRIKIGGQHCMIYTRGGIVRKRS